MRLLHRCALSQDEDDNAMEDDNEGNGEAARIRGNRLVERETIFTANRYRERTRAGVARCQNRKDSPSDPRSPSMASHA